MGSLIHRDARRRLSKNGFLYNQPSLESTEKRNKKVFFFFFAFEYNVVSTRMEAVILAVALACSLVTEHAHTHWRE